MAISAVVRVKRSDKSTRIIRVASATADEIEIVPITEAGKWFLAAIAVGGAIDGALPLAAARAALEDARIAPDLCVDGQGYFSPDALIDEVMHVLRGACRETTVRPLSERYGTAQAPDGKGLDDACHFLMAAEGWQSLTLDGSTVWSAETDPASLAEMRADEA